MTLSRTYEFLRKFGLASLLKRLKPVKMAFLTTKNFPNFPKFPNIFPGNPSSKKGAISREIPSSGNSQPNSNVDKWEIRIAKEVRGGGKLRFC